MQVQSSQTEWTARLEPARAAQLELEGRLWREGTIGLAQAAFQDWVNQAVQLSNLTRPIVTVAAQEGITAAVDKTSGGAADPVAPDGIWKVSAKLTFDFTPKGFYALMGRLAGHDKEIVVEVLLIRGAPIPRAEMVLVAYFQKPAAGVQGGTPDGVSRGTKK